MTVLCAWCKTILSVGRPAGPVSHGCCEPCLRRLLEENDAVDGAIAHAGLRAKA